MASKGISASWRDSFSVDLALCADGLELQAVADAMHARKGDMSNEDYTTLRSLYRRAVERIAKENSK